MKRAKVGSRSVRKPVQVTIGELLAAACDAVGPGPDVALRVSRLLSRGPLSGSVRPRIQFS